MTAEKTSFEFETVELNSERLARPVELNRIVSDIEIFEHIEKPYLTARMLLIDDSSFYQDADILGSESIKIVIRSLEDGASAITKNFFISKIEKVQKIQDNSQVIAFHLVEDIFYFSTKPLYLQNNYQGLLKNISSIKESIDMEKRRFKISSVKLEFFNTDYIVNNFKMSFKASLVIYVSF